MKFKRYYLHLTASFLIFLHAAQGKSQSLNLNAPAPVRQGNNQALIDSFVGDHYFFFYAEPGKFHISWTWGNANEGFNVGGKPSFAAAFNPKTQGSVMSFKEAANGTTYDGSVTQRTRVLVGVSPVNSKLVRQTTPYNLVVTGNVSFADTSSGPDPIVGLYAQKLLFQGEAPLGAVKFLANGAIITSNGGEGSWKLFDADSGIYSVTVGGRRMTLTLQRGRALVDTGNKSTVFELQQSNR
jgi:hypothetical protein